jgi:hypothetical protein
VVLAHADTAEASGLAADRHVHERSVPLLGGRAVAGDRIGDVVTKRH